MVATARAYRKIIQSSTTVRPSGIVPMDSLVLPIDPFFGIDQVRTIEDIATSTIRMTESEKF